MKLKESWFVITQLYKVDQTLGKKESLCSKNLLRKKKKQRLCNGILRTLEKFLNYYFHYINMFQETNNGIKAIVRQLGLLIACFEYY
jgi:hypothetical protein